MPRHDSDEEEKRIIWERILQAAMRHHGRTKEYGMQKVISADTGPEGTAGYVGTAAVSKWSKWKSKPERDTLRKLADIYGVPLNWLQGREGADLPKDMGPPDALLRQAASITEAVVKELLPEGTTNEFINVMKRAHELLLEGKNEEAAGWQLFLEFSQKKQETKGENRHPDGSADG
ncbi:hypothetical protein L0636_01085 [Halomonas janggokensis]|uniref:HTH cro/C1-type domain-containing protein n=1 Tax=Vreelandella janggokensis TaxID=370767 RepID=A0ABT4IU07_9GAMM|nr:hypothetical protein [Halomonas janggokensis]MCZ0926482.1 hypothetical protein [Halomonas janggokensis]MCZ0929020.1 hypothetical protein [Halomonas janggokensis]